MFQDKLSLGEMKQSLEELQEAIKCPICLDVLSHPLLCCVNRHCICASCKEDIQSCPTCKGMFSEVTLYPLAFQNVLDAMPKECKNSGNGCDRFMRPLALKDHEKTCSYRIVCCQLIKCSWKGQARSLLFHIKADHSDLEIFSETIEWTDSLATHETAYDVAIVYTFDCLFFLFGKIDVQKEKYLLFLNCIPTVDGVVNTFYSVIDISNKESRVEYKYTQKIYNEDVDTETIYSSEKCIAIPFSEIPNLCNRDGKVYYKLNIFPISVRLN